LNLEVPKLINVSTLPTSEKQQYTVHFNEVTPIKIPLKLNEKDDLIQRLHIEIQNTKIRMSEIESDKAQAINQLETMQKHYDKIISNLQSENKKRGESSKDLHDEIKDLKSQLDLLEKRTKSMQNERDRYKELRDEKDNIIHDINKEIIFLKTSKEEEIDSKNLIK